MSELELDTGAAHGSSQQKKIIGDLNSAVVREILCQLNAAVVPITGRINQLATASTLRVPLGLWRHDAWIRDLFFINENAANALSNAATDMALIKYAAGAHDLAAAGTKIFGVEGFNTGNFPAKTALYGDQFVAGTNCDAISTGSQAQGIIISAGELLAVEFINTEGANRNLIYGVNVAFTDRLDLEPGTLQRYLKHKTQNFFVKSRGTI